jgi:hypothetical protein
VVEEHAGAEAVDDLVSIADAEEVGDDAFGVADVGEALGEVGAVVLEDALAFADSRRRGWPRTGRAGGAGCGVWSVAGGSMAWGGV